jgi:prophage regulatory protein
MRPTPPPASPELTFLRERQVLARIPVSRATWWRWIKAGRAPKPVRLGPGIVAWRVSDIDALAASFGTETVVTATESNATQSRVA